MAMNLGTATATITLNNSGFLSGVNEAESAITRLGASGSKIGALGKVAGGLGTALAIPFLAGLKGAVDLEQSIANVNAALGGVDVGTLDQLQASIQEIGVKSQYSAVEVAGVTENLAKTGMSTEKIMGGATQAVVDLSQATGDGLEPAFTGIVQAMSTWNPELVGATIGMGDASRAADILTTAANQSTAGLTDIIGGMRPLGPVAASMGISYEESAAAIALFTNNGLKGADAGISLARGLQNLADPTSEAAGLMGDLGIAAFDMEGTFVGFPSLFRQLQGSMGGMSDQAQLTALSTIFGAEAMDVMGLAIMNGAEPLEAMIALMAESGTAAEQSALRMDTLGAQFDTLKEGVLTLAASFVSGLLPGFRFVVDGANMLVDAMMRIPAPIKTIIGALAGLAVAFAALTIGPQILGGLLGSIGLGTGVFAGFGAALSALIVPALAVAAVAGTIYAAWRTNFLGFRDLVSGAVDGVTGAFTGLKDLWDDVWSDLDGPTDFMDRINDIGGVTGQAAKYGNRFARVLATIGGVMRRLSGMRFLGWLDPIGKGFQKAGDFVEAFTDAWTSLTNNLRGMDRIERIGGILDLTGRSFDIAGIALRSFAAGFDAIGLGGVADGFERLAGKVEGAGTVFRALREQGLNPLQAGFHTLMVTVPRFRALIDTLEPAWRPAIAAFTAFRDGDYAEGFRQVGQSILGMGEVLRTTAVNLGSIAVRIGGWVIEQAVDLGSAVLTWIRNTALPTVGRAAQDIGAFAVRIGSWLVSAAINLGSAVLTWITGTALPTVGRAALAIGDFAVRIGGWLVESAINLGSAVLTWIRDTALPTVGRAAQNIGEFAVRIGGWLVSAAINIGSAVVSWIRDTALPTISRAAQNIGDFAVMIGGWLVSAAVNIGSAVVTWVRDTALPTIARVAMDIGTFALAIIDWTVTSAVAIGERVWSWITGTAIPSISRVAMDIGTFALKIADWLVSSAVMIGERVWSWITAAAGAISRVALDIGSFAVRIGAWVVSAAINIGSAVVSWIRDVALPSLGTFIAGIPSVAARIAGWLVESAVNIGSAVVTWIRDVALPSLGTFVAGIPSVAVRIMKWAVEAATDIVTDVRFWIASVALPTVTSLIGAIPSVTIQIAEWAIESATNLGDAVTTWLEGQLPTDWSTIGTTIRDGVMGAIGSAFTSGEEVGEAAAGAINIGTSLLDSLTAQIKGIDWSTAGETVGKGIGKAIIAFFLGVGALAGLTLAFTAGLANALAKVQWATVAESIWRFLMNVIAATDEFLVGLGVGLYDAFIGSLENVSWSGIADEIKTELLAALKDEFEDFDLSDFLFGNEGKSDKDILTSGLYVPKGGGGRGSGEELQGFTSGMQGAGFGGLVVQIRAVRTEMSSAIPIAGQLKKAIASISGRAGAGMAGAAVGAAGEAKDAVAGGGPFASLKTGADQLKTTITGLGTTLSTFNSGPLTTLNAGFPILGATVLAFNSGPLTTLNAAWPILTASMMAFNSGPLTTLNAGFPILSATILAFNAGPLTTLNAAFPILTASMNAFNSGPLTLLNAGFPILAATILAFNAGPLTTLNAAFPILTASMLAFNAGPLTLLNAGFPILAATILAFNAGPLTTLNAAWPILTASMLAFNAGPLTVLNAGFPLLGATILAFNAGALTTLNAAFPLLTASMVAFNAGGLTLLNAGFPILGATILAFNSGPLTTLNAAFPILVASMGTLDTAMTTSGSNVTTFGGTVTTMSADVSTAFAEMSGAATTAMGEVESAVQTGMANSSAAISSEAGTWSGIISGFAVGMSSSGFAVGYAAGEGVARGLNSTLFMVQSAAAAIATAAAAAMKSAAVVSSPSKLTTETGMYMGMGMATGILSQSGVVTSAAVSVVNAALVAARRAAGINSPASEWIPPGVSMDDGLAKGIWAGRSTVINAAVNVVRQAQAAAAAQAKQQTLTFNKGLRAEDGSRVNDNFYRNNPPEFERWKKLWTSGDRSQNWTTFKRDGEDAGNAFIGGVRNSLQMHSPSRVLTAMGETAGQSFARGFAQVLPADPLKAYRASANGRFVEEWLNVGKGQRDALDRALGTRTLASPPRRGTQGSAATRAAQRPNPARGATHVTYVTHTETTHAPIVNQVVPEELHRIMVDSRDGGSAAASLRSARPAATARSGRRAPLRGI